MIITIDGPVATGKSTIAKKLALALGCIYYDTGAMYRGITYAIRKNQIDLKNTSQLEEFLKTFTFDIKIKRGVKRYFVGNEDVTEKIREPDVTAFVSEVSANPTVREKLVALQREYAQGVNAVFEGRDMGTTVFPDADLKIFLTGRSEVRAERRYKELKERFPEKAKGLTMEQVLEDLNKRDQYDSTRKVSPLCKAEDACEVDTSDLTPEEIVLSILECKDKMKRR